MRSKVTPGKVGVGLKRRREPSRRRLGWRLAWWGSTEKKEASLQLILLNYSVYFASKLLCVLHCVLHVLPTSLQLILLNYSVFVFSLILELELNVEFTRFPQSWKILEKNFSGKSWKSH